MIRNGMIRVWMVVCVLFVGCKRHEAPIQPTARDAGTPTTHGMVGKPVVPGTLRHHQIHTRYAVAVAPGQDLAKIENVAKSKGPQLSVSHMALNDLYDDNVLGYATRRLTPADVSNLKASPGLVMLDAKGTDGLKVAKETALLTAELADLSHGWVLDPDTFDVFTAADFQGHIPDGHLDVRKLINVHSIVGDNKQPFLDTAGLNRYGLPELYVPEAAPGQINQIMHLMNGAAQVLLDGGDVDDHSMLAIDFKKLGWNIDILDKGTGKATWKTRWAHEEDDGDPNNLVVELVPPTGPGIEEQAKMIDECFGAAPEQMVSLKADDPELLAAAQHARNDLTAMRAHFAKGIPLEERLTIKAKFTGDDGGVEWMWVDVVAFKGASLSGTLANDPDLIKTMRNGQKVTVKLADVGDYILEKKDGSTSGGYSIEVMRKRGLLPEGD